MRCNAAKTVIIEREAAERRQYEAEHGIDRPAQLERAEAALREDRGGARGVRVQPETKPADAAFGDVWLAGLGAGPEHRLIISGRRYASGRPDMVLTAVIDVPPEHPSDASPAP
jgi:hypothetical protein